MPMVTTDGWTRDQFIATAEDALAESLLVAHATKVGEIQGDAPVIRCGYLDDAAATFVDEGAQINESEIGLSEVSIVTRKLALLVRVSHEQWRQEFIGSGVGASVRRSITDKSNAAFLAQSAPAAPAIAPVAGMLNTSGIVDGGAVATNLDKLVDLVAELEANKATPTAIILDPTAWASLRKLKTQTGSNQSLVGAGVSDAAPQILGLPVTVSPAMTAGSGIVIDKSAVLAAYDQLRLDTSTEVFFASDSLGVRATWRFGWTLAHADRIGKFTVTA